MAITNFLTLTDVATTNKLFGGSIILCYGANLNLSLKNNVQGDPKVGVETELISADNSTIGSMWERRKHRLTHMSTENLVITVSGMWTTDLGSKTEAAGAEILTAYKLLRMSISDHTFYLMDQWLVPSLVTGELGGGSFWTSSGIPVVFESLSISEDVMSTNTVRWNVTFKEDKLE